MGYQSEESIRIALQTAATHYRRDQKEEALQMLQKVLEQPGAFVNDPVWKPLVLALMQKTEPLVRQTVFRKQPQGFRVFGREGIDDEAFEQMQTAMKLPITVDGALMPDAHVGYGLPIGAVVAAFNAVIPYGVGMDIGCRMCLSVYPVSANTIDSDRDRLRNILLTETRFGNAGFTDTGDHELFERREFREIKFLRGLKKTFMAQLGSSGHGNQIGRASCRETV